MNLKQHIGLFEGFGGFSIAARACGYSTAAWVEIEPFCQTILSYWFPEAKGFGDIRNVDFKPYANSVRLLTAGFPCQPFSSAGNRKGESDNRFLWPETLRAIREARPEIVLLENVTGLLTILERESYNEVECQTYDLLPESDGTKQVDRLERRVIARIIEELEKEGYSLPRYSDGTPIVLSLPACAVGAPHRRQRVWLAAYRNGSGKGATNARTDREEAQALRRQEAGNVPQSPCGNGYATRTHRPEPRPIATPTPFAVFPTEPPICGRNDGLSEVLDPIAVYCGTTPPEGGNTFEQWAKQAMHGFGNAIVPELAERIIRALDEAF